MSAIDNTPAFPGPGEVIDRIDPGTGGPAYDVYGPATQGMSLRDWFAGQALSSLILQQVTDVGGYAYAYADAMLAARSTPSQASDHAGCGGLDARARVETVMLAIWAEIDRQCAIGAGTAETDSETGLFVVNADLDIITLARAIVAALSLNPTRDEESKGG